MLYRSRYTVLFAMAAALALFSLNNVIWSFYLKQSQFQTEQMIASNGQRFVSDKSPLDAVFAPFASGFEICGQHRRPSDADIVTVESNWQMVTVNIVGKKPQQEQIYLYSAYYDDRPAAGTLPSVRILALSTLRRNATVHCAVWFQGVDRPYTVRAIVNADVGSGYTFNRKNHREYAYICPLPAFEPIPATVSVSGMGPCPAGTYTAMIPVRHTPRTDSPPMEFGVCVTAGYGYIAPEVIVEWVELNRMFGAAEINLYDTSYAENMSTTFDYYKNIGVLNVHMLRHPKQSDKSGFFNKVRNVRIVALNDCQLMNMYRYRFVVHISISQSIIRSIVVLFDNLR